MNFIICKQILSIFAVLAHFAENVAEHVKKCYYCEGENKNCLDLAQDKLQEQDCSFTEITKGLSEVSSLLGTSGVHLPFPSGDTICLKFEVKDQRGLKACFKSLMGDLSTCNMLQKIAHKSRYKIKCSSCKKDLCNCGILPFPTFLVLVTTMFTYLL